MDTIAEAKLLTADDIVSNLVDRWNEAIAQFCDAEEANNRLMMKKADDRATAAQKAASLAFGLSMDDAMDFLNGF